MAFLADPKRDRHIRRSGDNYVHPLLRLFPLGIAWPRKPGTVFFQVVRGLAQIWGFVDGRAADLLEIESDPRKTTDLPSYGPYRGLLSDWERNWGLPDPCFPETISEEDRRRMLVLVMTLLGGQSRKFYEDIAHWVGDEIEISEYAPYMCGVSEVGDTVGEYDDTGNFRWYLGAEEIRFAWTIRSDSAVLKWFRTGAGGGECGVDHHLEIYTEAPLDCLLQRWKPAHTEIFFDYQASLDAADVEVS